MADFPSGTRAPFARAVTAELRARMAAERITLRDFAAKAGFKSHNYLAIRLRDEKPFTLDDVDLVAAFFDESGAEFIAAACEHHEERLWTDAMDLRKKPQISVQLDMDEPGAQRHLSDEEREAAAAVKRLDEHTRRTRPARTREEMQQMEPDAARDEDHRA